MTSVIYISSNCRIQVMNYAATSNNLSICADTCSGENFMYFSGFFVKFTFAYLKTT